MGEIVTGFAPGVFPLSFVLQLPFTWNTALEGSLVAKKQHEEKKSLYLEKAKIDLNRLRRERAERARVPNGKGRGRLLPLF